MNPIKALIFDLDGTAIPNSPDGMPSTGVIDAVNKAKERVKVACATGRELKGAKNVIETFQFASPCILAGGAQIIDPISFLPIWQKVLTPEKLREIVLVCTDFPYQLGAWADDGPGKPAKDYDYFFEKPILYMMGVPIEEKDAILTRLKTIEGINTHAVVAWYDGLVDIHITNNQASKKLAMQEWLRIEQVQKDEVLVIGDSGNDLPLFESAGIKVAMENGSSELKSQADWIAPSVDADGVARTIEKYILT